MESNNPIEMEEFLLNAIAELPTEQRFQIEQIKRAIPGMSREQLQDQLIAVQTLLARRSNVLGTMEQMSAINLDLRLEQQFELFASRRNMGAIPDDGLRQLLLYAAIQYVQQSMALINEFRNATRVINNAGFNQ